MKRKALLLALVCFLVLSSSALAMYSTNYRLDWFTPLTSGGGAPASSTNYKLNFTVGQVAIVTASSTNYRVGLGYWQPIMTGTLLRHFLPFIHR